MFLLCFLYLCTYFPASTSKERIPEEICRGYVQCRREVLERIDKCPGGLSPTFTDYQGCSSVAKSKMKLLHSLQWQKQQQQLNCIESRIQRSVPLHPRKPRVCDQKVLDDYARFVNTTAHNSTITRGSSSSTSRIENWTEEDDIYEKWEKEIERHRLQGRRKRDSKDTSASIRNRCMSKLSEHRHQCAILRRCCSEVTKCESEFKSTPLYLEICQLQLEIFNQLRQCQS